ncbi:MAG: type I restriction endonuclease subunit M, partial [Phototrophicaceae bacterium]
IKRTIFDHPEFTAYARQVTDTFHAWQADTVPRLQAIQIGDRPKPLIEQLSNDLLHAFEPLPLIDAYNIYQHLMTYWTETMQDDVYVLVADGWQAGRTLRLLIKVEKKKGEKTYTEAHDFELDKKHYKADLIPTRLVIARYLAAEQQAVDALVAELATVEQTLSELEEEHSGEDGLLAEVTDDKSNHIVAKKLKDRLKVIANSEDDAEEFALLTRIQGLMDEKTVLKKKKKAAEDALYTALIAQYAALSEDEIKQLLIEDKWMAALEAATRSELDRVSQALTGRVKLLAERYATPLPEIEARVAESHRKVQDLWRRMGYSW